MGQLIDLTGQRFGSLLVLKRAPDTYTKSGNLKVNWFCLCDCGKHVTVDGKSLRSGATQSCGDHKQKDITGQRFGKLTAVCIVGQDKYSRNVWQCLCDCGNYINVMIGNLTSGNTQSCGCGHDGHPTHRETRTRLYNIWQGMKSRCYYTNDDAYANYGARGVSVCSEWKNDFLAFKKWALENNYSDTLTIERKDVNGNYCPENCCWISRGNQANNKRNTIRINGQTLKEISKATSIKYDNLYSHYRKGNLNEWLLKQGIQLTALTIQN